MKKVNFIFKILQNLAVQGYKMFQAFHNQSIKSTNAAFLIIEKEHPHTSVDTIHHQYIMTSQIKFSFLCHHLRL